MGEDHLQLLLDCDGQHWQKAFLLLAQQLQGQYSSQTLHPNMHSLHQDAGVSGSWRRAYQHPHSHVERVMQIAELCTAVPCSGGHQEDSQSREVMQMADRLGKVAGRNARSGQLVLGHL